jgi:outer membrane protein assembly factor BamD (BamD/ComL family)
MTLDRRATLLHLRLLVALFVCAACGCSSITWPTSHSDGLTVQQERWWTANAPQARFVAGKGWEVPGTPGYFDASGKPLTKDVAATSIATASSNPSEASSDRNSAASIWGSVTGRKLDNGPQTAAAQVPPIAEPAPDLTPEQKTWWRTNRHLARWTPQGYLIDGIEGTFDSVGHLTPPGQARTVAPANYSADGASRDGAAATYAPPVNSNSTDGTKGDSPGAMTMWDRITGRTSHDDEDSGSVWWFSRKEKSQPKAKEAMAAGDQAFREQRYSEAEAHYAEAASLWPNSPLQEDALFQRAECLFFANTYPAAFEAYETLLTKYKRSRHLEKAVAREFAIGNYWFQMQDFKPQALLQPNLTDKTRPRLDTLGSALKAMEKVRLNDPTGPLADDSLMATANSYFLRQRYVDADFNYTLLRKEYPKSDHQYQAHVLGIQAKLAIYQGPGYDGTPLKGAQDLIDQTLAQFREVTPEERDRLLELKEKIVTARAERDWHMAQYYEGRGYHGAARHYYAQMLKEYPNSQVAQLVSKRLAEIQELPTNPEPRLTWISAIMPEPYDPKRLTLNEPAPADGTVRR